MNSTFCIHPLTSTLFTFCMGIRMINMWMYAYGFFYVVGSTSKGIEVNASTTLILRGKPLILTHLSIIELV